MNEPKKTAVPGELDEFYAGYLPLPPGYLFYLRMIMPGFLWLAFGVAAVVSSSQPEPGPGIWSSGEPRAFRGLVEARPYPMLHVQESGKSDPQTLLLVETGKFGGGRRAAPFDGRTVRVSGWLIERDGRKMIELEPGDAAITELAPGQGTLPARRALGTATLRGEIVDSKCFLGVMKPGEGKTHKECATLCVAGGIPPMLVTRDAAGARSYYLLVGPDGNGLDAWVLPYIADPVEVFGRLEEYGDLKLLSVDPGHIRRL